MTRPLFKKTTDELTHLFHEWYNSPEQLRVLVAELNHRERSKAVALRKKVEGICLARLRLRPNETCKGTRPDAVNKTIGLLIAATKIDAAV